MRIEDAGDFHRVVEVRHAVARAMVQQIAEEHESVVAQTFSLLKGGRQRGRHAVDVADEENAHGRPNLRVLPVLHP